MAFKISALQVKTSLEAKTGVVVIEALPPEYFRKGHIPGAINLDHEANDQEIAAALPDRLAEIIVYCASGPCENSGILANRLLSLGYLNTVDFHEGKEGWVRAGYALVRE